MLPNKIDIRTLNIDQIKEAITAMGEPAFRSKQIFEWLWQKSATDFDMMTNLSLPMREKLKEQFCIRPVTIFKTQISSDRTIKNAFQLHDAHIIEGVLIPTSERMTACISSQVGCSLSCKFCATGYMDRVRNLDASEIYDQVVLLANQAKENYGIPLSNIVYMGMGEPLLNYKNTLASVEKITSPQGLGMSPSRITVSTAGIAKMIRQLGDDEVKFNLAVSLHAANDIKRNEIMPINETNTLEILSDALLHFYEKTKSRITFEYIVFDNFNDSIEDARELYNFCKKIPSKVNIIEYNPISNADFMNTGVDKLEIFKNFLERKGIIVNIRRSRGKDIDAACGQLANKQ